jgi:glycosyltransferase involved in cell wall biosynthesis
MKIVLVSQFFSEGMGYTENILPKYLSKLGHEVIVIASDFQVYGNSPSYAESYSSFLGDSKRSIGESKEDGFVLHRLESYSIAGYVVLKKLSALIKKLKPDIVQFIQIAGINNFSTLLSPLKLNFSVFTECHQHISISKNITGRFSPSEYIENFWYRISRTIPSFLSHCRVEKCFAISPDCEIMANKLYGVPVKKIVPLSLGTDTQLFHSCKSKLEKRQRNKLRFELGISSDQILVVYTGRFSKNKNPLILGKAIESLYKKDKNFTALFIGSGEQEIAIKACKGCQVINFQPLQKLAEFYRAADIALWPREESMSMLDASASGLPLIVSNKMGELDRVLGNGLTYIEGDVDSLIESLDQLKYKPDRDKMSQIGVEKMIKSYSWLDHAKTRIEHYQIAISK